MIYDACELIGPDGTLALGTVTHSPEGSSGYTCELNTAAAPLVVYRADLKQSQGSVVVPGRRSARELVLRGQVVGTTRADLAARWSTLLRYLGDLDGGLLGVRVTIPADDLFTLPQTRVMRGAIDGTIGTERVTPLAETFEVRIVCPDPVAYADTTNTATLTGPPGVSVTGAGDTPVAFEATIAGPSSGTVTGLRIGNTTTGDAVTVTGISLTAGGVVEFDSTPGRETLKVDNVSVAGKITAASRWPLVRPGTNQIFVEVTAGTGTPTGTIEWADGWVS